MIAPSVGEIEFTSYRFPFEIYTFWQGMSKIGVSITLFATTGT